MKRYLFAFAALTIAILSSIPVVECGKMVVVGGDLASDNAPVYNAFINQSSPGTTKAYIGVITAGSTWSTAESIAKGIIYRLKNMYKADTVEWLPFHKDNGDICTGTSLNSKLNSMTGVYFNGGETDYILECFFKNGVASSALSIIKTRFNSDSLSIFASSAGALALQATPVLGTKSSWSSLYTGTSLAGDKGFGIFTFGFLDVHFTNRGRMGRLVQLSIEQRSKSKRAYGIDQDTAMIVDGDSFKVLGSGGVYVLQTGIATKGTTGKRMSVQNVAVFLLTDGDTYNTATGAVTYPSYKKAITASTRVDAAAPSSSDIFADQEFMIISTSLIQSKISTTTYGLTKENFPKFRVDMRRTSATSGVVGTSGAKSLVSYKNLYIDIYCTSGSC